MNTTATNSTTKHSNAEKPGRAAQQRSIDTRQKLYVAALSEFRRVGFANAQIDVIAEAAGVSRASFYFHFKTKEDVLRELQHRRAVGMAERFRLSVEELPTKTPKSVQSFLKLTLNAILNEVEAQSDPELLRELLALQIRSPYKEAASDPVANAVLDFFNKAAELGWVRSDISPRELARAFMSCVFTLLMEAAEPQSRQRQGYGGIIQIFLRGVSP